MMSLMGKDFDDAMKEIKLAAIQSQRLMSDIDQIMLKLNEIITKINATLK